MNEKFWSDLLRLFLTTCAIGITVAGIIVGVAWKMGMF